MAEEKSNLKVEFARMAGCSLKLITEETWANLIKQFGL
jgi:hypothetical protein